MILSSLHVEVVVLEKPDYSRMTEQQKKDTKAEYEAEKKRVDAYNKALKETRKTELPPLYEPLIVNCDLLFALADKLNISNEKQLWIENILQTKDNGVFLSDAINNRYSFNEQSSNISIVYDGNTIEVPVNLLSQGATISVEVKMPLSTGGYATTTYSDWNINSVKRDGDSLDLFTAYYSSSTIKKIDWAVGAEITVSIYNGESYEPIVFHFKVTECKNQFPFGTKVIFEEV